MDADDSRSAGGGLALSWSIWGKDRRCEIGHGQKGKMLMEEEMPPRLLCSRQASRPKLVWGDSQHHHKTPWHK